MAYDTLKAEIRQYITTNGANEITGQILQNVLLDMVNAYPSLDGYATQQWVQNQLSDMATQTWVGQQGFITNSALANYLPLRGGVMTGPITAGTLSTGSYSLGNTGLSFEYSYNGNPRYAHAIRISSVDGTITFIGRGGASTGTVITGGNITSGGFIVSGGTSSEFLKADGSVDSNTYLTTADLSSYATQQWVGNNYLALSGGTMGGELYFDEGYGIWFTLSQSARRLWRMILGDDGTYYMQISEASQAVPSFYIDKMMNVKATSFIVNNGTSAQFLKADGSVDSNTYLTSSAISDMATQTWVGQQGFLTSVPSGYATETWVGNNYLPLTGGTLTGDLNIAYSSKLNFGTSYINQSTIPGPQGTNMGHILNFYGVDGNGYYDFDNSVHATSFVKSGGTSAQFLKADGSVDSNTYLTSAAISDMATQTWVGNNYLALSGGTMTGGLRFADLNGSNFICYGEAETGDPSMAMYMNSSGDLVIRSYLHNTRYTNIILGLEEKVGIGTSTPTSRLDVSGMITVRDSATGFGKIYIDSDGINISGSDTQGNQVYLNAGNVYVSNTLDVDGNCSAYAFIQTSDIRRKSIINDVNIRVEDIAKAPLFGFTWKDGKDTTTKHVGTSAQYWQTLLPEVVSEDKKGTLAMQYDVTAIAIGIVTAKKVVDHEQRIAELEKENASLKAKLNIN